MARKRLYYKYEIPPSVVEIVTAICVDYDRRERAIRHSAITGTVLERYVELNAAVDAALGEMEVEFRRGMLEDIASGRGYHFSMISPYLAKNTYYYKKRKLIHDIALELALL